MTAKKPDDQERRPVRGIGLRDSYFRTGNRECPSCGRIMSHREGDEQGACNDCYGGDVDDRGTGPNRYPEILRDSAGRSVDVG